MALAPVGLNHARKRRGGCNGAGSGPAIHASGSFQISAFLCLYVYVMAQTGANGAAAIELLLSLPESGRENSPKIPRKIAIRGKSVFLNVA